MARFVARALEDGRYVLAEKFKMLLLVVTSHENRNIMKFLVNTKICIFNRENV